MAVCERYLHSRSERQAAKLRYRGKKRLGWLPLKASGIVLQDDRVRFAGVCLFGATAPAVAAAAPHTTAVSYADINIASANGHNTLDRRIVQAARSVCENGSCDVCAINEQTRCVDNAIADAHRKVSRTSASAN